MATINGSAGNDSISGSSGADPIYGGGSGNDTINAAAGNDTVFGGSGADSINGGDGNDSIASGGGNDTVFGGNGYDQLFGGAGADSITGGSGADVISGGSGVDVLSGGAGNDTLEGGTGADTFQFDQSGGSDIITDFNISLVDGKTTDQLDVSDLRTQSGTPVRWSDVTVSDDGFGNAMLTFPQGETVVLTGVTPAAATGKQSMGQMGIPCLTKSTKIRTPQGDRPVETLRRGDLVLTADHGPQAVLWVGQRHVTRAEMIAKPSLFPIRLRGARRDHDLIVSRQHAVLIQHDGQQVFVRAGHLADHGAKGVRQCKGARGATYYHVFLANHALLWTNGLLTESFYPGPIALQSLAPESCRTLLVAFPKLAAMLFSLHDCTTVYGSTARLILPRKSASNAVWAGLTQADTNSAAADMRQARGRKTPPENRLIAQQGQVFSAAD